MQELTIRLFGDFSITYEGQMLTQDEIRSDRVTKILAYLASRERYGSTVQELIDVFWPEEASDNPAGALKNLMYRARKALEQKWPGNDFLITARGSYQWNPEYEIVLDLQEMQRMTSEESFAELSSAQRIGKLTEVVDLYRGKVLSDYSNEFWVMALQAYYHHLYVAALQQLCELLQENADYSTMEKVCLRASAIDPLDEKIQYWLMKAYIGNKKQGEAGNHYRKTAQLLYDRLGVGPGQELMDLYTETMKETHELEADLEIIQKELQEEGSRTGAFFCEYGVFRKVYELEVRRGGRVGTSVFLVLITMSVKNHPKYKEYEADLHRKAMNQMQEVLMDSLRSGDLVTRYSQSQFLVMLQGCNYENAQRVVARIDDRYCDFRRHVRAEIKYSLREMEIQ